MSAHGRSLITAAIQAQGVQATLAIGSERVEDGFPVTVALCPASSPADQASPLVGASGEGEAVA